MYVDSQLLFSDAQAITSAVASTNYIDLSEVRDIGTGEDLYVVCLVDTAFTDTGSNSTLTVALEGDSSTTFTPDATQTLFTFDAVSAAGTVKYAKLDPGSAPLQLRYIQLKFTPVDGDLSAGAVTAFITKDISKYRAYADAITIS